MMTMHSAKGLEWPVVFVSTLNDRDVARSRKTVEPDVIPAELARDARGRPNRTDFQSGPAGRAEFVSAVEVWRQEQTELEDRRLFYVALTRAESNLYLTWSAQDPTRKGATNIAPLALELVDWLECVEAPIVAAPDPAKSMNAFAMANLPMLSSYLDDIDEKPASWQIPAALIAESWAITGADVAGLPFAFSAFAERKKQLTNDLAVIARVAEAQQVARNVLAQAQSGVLTYTQIEQFKRCPHRWYLRNRVGLPGIPDRSASRFGTDVHAALQREAEARRAGLQGGIPASSRPVEPEWKVGSPATASVGLHDPIQAYLGEVDATVEPILVEAEFTFAIGDVLVNGVIDRVHRHPDGYLEVVDYKTDRRLRSEAEIRAGLQLQIYLLAMRREFSEYQPVPTRATMFFLRHNKRVTVEFSEQDLNNAEREILRYALRMKSADQDEHLASPETCGVCEYRLACRFSQATAGSSPITTA
jgi:RecB family exonuclease